jgi:hypothetical protein
MPYIKTYDSQIAPQGMPQTAGAPNLGDGGLGALGQGLAGAAGNIYRRDLEKDDSDTVTEVARLRAELAERRQAAALNGDAADPEWGDKERAYAQDRLETLAGNMRTGDGRRLAKTRSEVFLADETNRWLATQATVSASLQKNQLQQVEDLTLRAIQKDPLTHGESTAAFLSDLEGPAYSRLSKDMKEDYVRRFRFNAARAATEGTEQTYGSQAALKMLDSLRDEMPSEQYTALRDHFTIRAKQEVAKDKEEEQYKLFQHISDVMKSGGNPLPLIDAGVSNKLMSAEQGIGFRDKYDKYVEHRTKVANADSAFRVGDLVGFEASDPAVKKEVADAWIAEQMGRYGGSDANGKKAIAGEIVRKGVEMDYVFAGIKNSLRTSPHSPGFGTAVDLYRSLEAFDPYYASKYVSDDQRARFEVYANAAQGGATAEQATVFAQNITPENIAKQRKVFSGADGKALADDIRKKLDDGPWLKGMINSRMAADDVMGRVVTQLAGNPSADVDKLISSALDTYASQNAQMGQLWVPRKFLSGVPADKMVAVADRITTRLPDVLRARKLPVVDGKYALAPDKTSDRDGRLQVYDPTGFPIPGLRFGPQDFQTEYRALQADEYKKAAERSLPGHAQKEARAARERFANPQVAP